MKNKKGEFLGAQTTVVQAKVFAVHKMQQGKGPNTDSNRKFTSTKVMEAIQRKP